jgi:hypothetical protein
MRPVGLAGGWLAAAGRAGRWAAGDGSSRHPAGRQSAGATADGQERREVFYFALFHLGIVQTDKLLSAKRGILLCSFSSQNCSIGMHLSMKSLNN